MTCMQTGAGAGTMLSAVHGFNTGSLCFEFCNYRFFYHCLGVSKVLWMRVDLTLLFWDRDPFVQKHVKGPKWLHLHVGVCLVDFGSCDASMQVFL
jgi:hypothetical protein